MTDKTFEEIQAERAAELEVEQRKIDPADTFALYWLDTAGASVLRDYRAGRAETIRAGRSNARRNARALKRAKKVERDGGGANDGSTEPTPEGLQYVIPGCEKRETETPAQMDLF